MLVGGSQYFLFSPLLGEDHPIWLYNIFQRGWNHQPECYVSHVPSGEHNSKINPPKSLLKYFEAKDQSQKIHAFLLLLKCNAVDGRNPAPGMVLKPCSSWDFNYQPQLVQDFSHQEDLHRVLLLSSTTDSSSFGTLFFTVPKNPKPSLQSYYGIQSHPQDISG